MRAAWCPSHLLLLDEAFGNDLIDCRLHKSGGDSFPAPKALPVCRCQRSCQFCQGLVGVSRMWVSVGTVRNRGVTTGTGASTSDRPPPGTSGERLRGVHR